MQNKNNKVNKKKSQEKLNILIIKLIKTKILIGAQRVIIISVKKVLWVGGLSRSCFKDCLQQ